MTPCLVGQCFIHTQIHSRNTSTHVSCCAHEGQLSPHHRGSIWPTEHTRIHTRLLAPSTCLCLCLNIPTSLKAQSLLSPSLVFIPCAALSFSLSFSLHTEVGHSGSTVYSNAAASGEKSKETHRGENREKEGRTHSAQFNISALTKKENTHTHTPSADEPFQLVSKSVFMTSWSAWSRPHVRPAHTNIPLTDHKSVDDFITLYLCLIINLTDRS